MAQQINQSQNGLLEILEEMASLGGLSGEQKKELLATLEEAIVLNISIKLIGKLSEDKRKLMNEQEFKVGEDLVKFLADGISREEFRNIATQSAEEIIGKFFDEI